MSTATPSTTPMMLGTAVTAYAKKHPTKIFHQFTKLPEELKVMIWDAAIEDLPTNIIRLSKKEYRVGPPHPSPWGDCFSMVSFIKLNYRIPAVLNTCQRSRERAMKVYKYITTSINGPINGQRFHILNGLVVGGWFNQAKDILYTEMINEQVSNCLFHIRATGTIVPKLAVYGKFNNHGDLFLGRNGYTFILPDQPLNGTRSINRLFPFVTEELIVLLYKGRSPVNYFARKPRKSPLLIEPAHDSYYNEPTFAPLFAEWKRKFDLAYEKAGLTPLEVKVMDLVSVMIE